MAKNGEGKAVEIPLGRYGLLRQNFLQQHYHGTYTSMLLTGRLMPHLHQTDRQAQEQVDRIVAVMMARDGVDEALKERNQMAWVQAVSGLFVICGKGLIPDLTGNAKK